MAFNREQQQTAYKKLSPDVQDFVLSPETSAIISGALKRLNLNPEIVNQADSEILWAMTGLQTIEVAVESINKISGKSINELASLKSELKTAIFDKIDALKKPTPAITPQPQTEPTLKSIPENVRPTTQAMAPRVEVKTEQHLVNLIPPPVPPAKPIDLLPSKALNIADEKLKQVVVNPSQTSVYRGTPDPYREPI